MDLENLPQKAQSRIKSNLGLRHDDLTNQLWDADSEKRIDASMRAAMLLGDLKAEGLVEYRDGIWFAKGGKKK